jgi:hypothetical protein
MSENTKNVETISFVHIGVDVIVPRQAKNENKTIWLISTFLFLSFGGAWFAVEQPWQNISWDSILWLLVFLFTPTIITIALLNMDWYEINRKDSTIKCWQNKRKKKLNQIIKKGEYVVLYDKVTTNAKYGTRQNKIFFRSNGANSKRYELFTLPKGIPDCVALQLTKEVTRFLDDFLSNKPIKPVNNQYTFTYHV